MKIVEFIIRLLKDNYDLSEFDLGIIQLETKKPYIREDFDIRSKRGYTI